MVKKPKTDEDGFALVLTKRTRSDIARHLGIAKQSLTRWRRVPPNHVKKVSELTGLSPAEILPSLFA
jgi:transposase-like protein